VKVLTVEGCFNKDAELMSNTKRSGSVGRLGVYMWLAQVILLLFGLAMHTRATYVRYGVYLQTPTCPQGIHDITVPAHIRAKCFEERMSIYLSNPVIIAARISVFTSLILLIVNIYMQRSGLVGRLFTLSIPAFALHIAVTIVIFIVDMIINYPGTIYGLVQFAALGP
jgi:hypothetical protein